MMHLTRLRRRVCPSSAWLAALVAIAAGPGCSGSAELPSPLVRVDLSDTLPKPAQRRLAVLEAAIACDEKVTLEDKGARQEVVVAWRVFEDEGASYITAVEVTPEGPSQGVSSASGSATVGEPQLKTAGGEQVATAAVHIQWSGRSGCSSVEVREEVVIRADDPGCERPKLPQKIFSGE